MQSHFFSDSNREAVDLSLPSPPNRSKNEQGEKTEGTEGREGGREEGRDRVVGSMAWMGREGGMEGGEGVGRRGRRRSS
jgi:hypothetical protein